MAKTFSQAGKETTDLVATVLTKYHGHLAERNMQIGVLFVSDEADTGAVLKHNGYPAAAVVKINSYRDRVEGKPDATITIDEDHWQSLSGEERTALIDHELYHLELATDKDGAPKFDDLGRPKLRIRLHDWQLGGFDAVVKRHGTNAPEQQHFQQVAESRKQLLIPWG